MLRVAIERGEIRGIEVNGLGERRQRLIGRPLEGDGSELLAWVRGKAAR
jgi:hypothetical protein